MKWQLSNQPRFQAQKRIIKIKTQPLLEARNVSRVFTVRRGLLGGEARLTAVDDVSFSLAKGESLGLVGESGCGKSTLGRIVCGLLRGTSGQILLNGRELPLAGASSWASGRVQMVFQDPVSSLDPRMSAASSVAEPLLAAGVCRSQALQRAADLLATVGLAGLGRRYPHQFSGGQRQRIAIARSLITSPELIVCDEPVSALDASVQAQILNLLRDLQAQFQPAYLFISHDLAVIGFMCPRIMVMYLGQIVEKGPSGEIFAHPGHPYTAALLAAMPQGEKRWAKGKASLPPPLSGELPSPLNPPSGCYFHPRCPIAREICAKEAPPWQKMGPDWQARCHFAGQI